MSRQLSGGGKCSLCGSQGTNMTSCPLNDNVKNPNYTKHHLAQQKPKLSVLDDDDVVLKIKPNLAHVTFKSDDEAMINIILNDTLTPKYHDVDKTNYMNIAAHLNLLYAGNLPRGKIRHILCALLDRIIELGYLSGSDYISLVASGSINDSYMALIKMYSRMSFIPVATKMSEDYDSVYTIQQLKADMERNVEVDEDLIGVLMITQVDKLRQWCIEKY